MNCCYPFFIFLFFWSLLFCSLLSFLWKDYILLHEISKINVWWYGKCCRHNEIRAGYKWQYNRDMRETRVLWSLHVLYIGLVKTEKNRWYSEKWEAGEKMVGIYWYIETSSYRNNNKKKLNTKRRRKKSSKQSLMCIYDG